MQLQIARCIVLLAAISVLMVAPSNSGSSQSGNNGIDRLSAVAMLKAGSANDEALRGAEKQRDLVKQQKTERDKARETAVLRQLEANATRTAEVLQSVKAIDKHFRANPCK